MSKTERNPNIPQLPLKAKEKGVETPFNLEGLEDGSEIHRIIIGQKLWKEKPGRKKKTLVVDERFGITGLLENESLKFSQTTFTGEVLTDKKLSSVITVASELLPDDVRLGVDSLHSIGKKLTNAGVLFIFEKKSESTEFDKDWRLERMKLAGFKKIDVLTGLSKDFLVWRGRKQKVSKRRPTNLLESKNKAYYQTLWEEMARNYRQKGYRIIKAKESDLFSSLQSTTFPPKTTRALIDGYGVQVKGLTCGCEWEVKMDGTVFNTKECVSGICQGEPSG